MSNQKQTEEEHWAGPGGNRWLKSAIGFEDTFEEIGEELLRRAKLAANLHVLEVGCGAGGLTLEIAKRVAPAGSVTGLDISADLIHEAARRAKSNSHAATFVAGDAAKAQLPRKFDRLVSRFGSMFFTEPYPAFEHLRAQLAPGGTIALACWGPLKFNLWMAELRDVLSDHFDIPEIPPRLPGPFAFDEPDYLRDILTKAGFQNIEIELWKSAMPLAGVNSTPESAADFMMHGMGVAQRVFDAGEGMQNKIFALLCDRFKTYHTSVGVQTPCAVYFTTARA